MKKLTLCVAVCASFNAYADEPLLTVEAGLGGDHFNNSTQLSLQSAVRQNSFAFEAGLTGRIVSRETWGVNWHLDYVNLGQSSFLTQSDASAQKTSTSNVSLNVTSLQTVPVTETVMTTQTEVVQVPTTQTVQVPVLTNETEQVGTQYEGYLNGVVVDAQTYVINCTPIQAECGGLALFPVYATVPVLTYQTETTTVNVPTQQTVSVPETITVNQSVAVTNTVQQEVITTVKETAQVRTPGHGNTQGLKLAFETYYKHNNLKASFEFGPFLYRPDYSYSVAAETLTETFTSIANVTNETVSETSNVMNYSISHKLQVGAVIGGGVSYKNTTLAIEHYFMHSAIRGATVAMLVQRF
jgi:hypothetical protein